MAKKRKRPKPHGLTVIERTDGRRCEIDYAKGAGGPTFKNGWTQIYARTRCGDIIRLFRLPPGDAALTCMGCIGAEPKRSPFEDFAQTSGWSNPPTYVTGSPGPGVYATSGVFRQKPWKVP